MNRVVAFSAAKKNLTQGIDYAQQALNALTNTAVRGSGLSTTPGVRDHGRYAHRPGRGEVDAHTVGVAVNKGDEEFYPVDLFTADGARRALEEEEFGQIIFTPDPIALGGNFGSNGSLVG